MVVWVHGNVVTKCRGVTHDMCVVYRTNWIMFAHTEEALPKKSYLLFIIMMFL